MTESDSGEHQCAEAEILNNALVIIAVLERSGKIVTWNHAAESITGYGSAEVTGKAQVWRDLYPDREYRAHVTGRIRSILAMKNYFDNFETVIRTRSGKTRTILWNTKEVDVEGNPRIVTVGVDITIQKELGNFRESIIDNASILLAVLGEKGEILVWNKAAEAITGFFRTEVIGRRDVWKYLYPDPDYRKEVTGQITRILEKHQYFENLETSVTTKSGGKRVISWNTRLMEAGGASHAIAIGRDITQQRLAEESLTAYISEMTMRLKQPIGIMSENLHEVAGLIREKKISPEEIIMVLEAQVRNADQIAANVSEFQRAIVEKNRAIPDAYRQFLER